MFTRKNPTDNSSPSVQPGQSSVAVSRLGLGTVQFGLDYGISNVVGQCSLAETGRILKAAQAAGIRMLDTAASYGTAEKAIGECAPDEGSFDIVTKTFPIHREREASADVRRVIEGFEESCDNLSRRHLYGILVHHVEDLLGDEGRRLYDLLLGLKDDGRVSKIGASVYDAAQIDAVVERFELDLIQLPVNLFDQRLVRNGYIGNLKSKGIEIHARSVFLQGLLLMAPDELPGHFAHARGPLVRHRERLLAAGVRPLQAALGFVRDIAEVDVVLVGVNSLDHLRENISAFQTAPRLNFEGWALDDEAILNPREWPRP